MSKFKVGDHVRNNRSGKQDGIVKQGVIVEYSPYGGTWPYEVRGDDGRTELFSDTQLELLNEGGAKMARKTYKQIKETVDTKAGALWQEACDDGTQAYILITPELQKGRPTNPMYPDRSLVEEQPQWFVEVFQVEPQFMTALELERWEAFKATKPGKALVAKKTVAAVAKGTSYWTPARREEHSAKLTAAWAAKKAA